MVYTGYDHPKYLAETNFMCQEYSVTEIRGETKASKWAVTIPPCFQKGGRLYLKNVTRYCYSVHLPCGRGYLTDVPKEVTAEVTKAID